jgi:hypothetical protein
MDRFSPIGWAKLAGVPSPDYSRVLALIVTCNAVDIPYTMFAVKH